MREFFLIVGAALGSSVLGGGFGFLVGRLSPEVIDAVMPMPAAAGHARIGAALGLMSGLLLGAATMAFGLLVSAVRAWANRPPRTPAEEREPERLPVVPTADRPRSVREA